MAALKVRKSTIAGLGVFTTRRFSAGEIVVRWNNPVQISEAQLSTVSANDRAYLVPLGGGGFLLLGEPERYVNHSCEPNTKTIDYCDVALRDIEQGEEVTSDYGQNQSVAFGFACICGKRSCRNWIGPL